MANHVAVTSASSPASVRSNEPDAIAVVAAFTAAAAANGALPVPGASAGIVANNGIMIAYLASLYGQRVTVSMVANTIGLAGGANIVGRTIFVEAARGISWGTGMPWGAFLVSAIGATTAAIQTMLVGMVTIAMCRNGGRPLNALEMKEIHKYIDSEHKTFIADAKAKAKRNPEAYAAIVRRNAPPVPA